MDIEGNNIVTGGKIILKFKEINGKVLPVASLD